MRKLSADATAVILKVFRLIRVDHNANPTRCAAGIGPTSSGKNWPALLGHTESRPGQSARLKPGATRYRLAELGALALKSAVWETMITQRPLRLAIREWT